MYSSPEQLCPSERKLRPKRKASCRPPVTPQLLPCQLRLWIKAQNPTRNNSSTSSHPTADRTLLDSAHPRHHKADAPLSSCAVTAVALWLTSTSRLKTHLRVTGRARGRRTHRLPSPSLASVAETRSPLKGIPQGDQIFTSFQLLSYLLRCSGPFRFPKALFSEQSTKQHHGTLLT